MYTTIHNISQYRTEKDYKLTSSDKYELIISPRILFNIKFESHLIFQKNLVIKNMGASKLYFKYGDI